MVITAETRTALLDGGDFGFASAKTAPKRFQDRIVEIRHAIIEKRSIPAPSNAYIRSAVFYDAPPVLRVVAPVRKANSRTVTMEQLSRQSGIPLGQLEAAALRNRLKKVGEQIAAERAAEPTALEAHAAGIGMSKLPWEN
jgi:hypothetical protein